MLMEQIESFKQCYVNNNIQIDVGFEIEKRWNEYATEH